MRSATVNGIPCAGAGMSLCHSPSVEKALRECEQLALTEACLSGFCDLCLYQTSLCMIGQPWKDAFPSGIQSSKNKSGAIQ